MKKFIKNKLRENYYPHIELGDETDVEMANIVSAKPYDIILAHVMNDWGKDSDLYHSLMNVFMEDRFDINKLIRVLKLYDVYDDYEHILNLNETI
jgi:hypothetical protein